METEKQRKNRERINKKINDIDQLIKDVFTEEEMKKDPNDRNTKPEELLKKLGNKL